MSLLSFYCADIKFKIKRKSDLKQFIPYIFASEEKKLRSLTIILCSDEYLLTLNKQHLQHDYYTDILTFDLSEGDDLMAEIYISIDRINENSTQLLIPLQNELYRIIFHGVLHLCGYKDKIKLQKKEMTAKEDEYLAKFDSFHVKQKIN